MIILHAGRIGEIFYGMKAQPKMKSRRFGVVENLKNRLQSLILKVQVLKTYFQPDSQSLRKEAPFFTGCLTIQLLSKNA